MASLRFPLLIGLLLAALLSACGGGGSSGGSGSGSSSSGSSSSGSSGSTSTSSSSSSTAAVGLVSLAAGGQFNTVVIKTAGSVFSWGNNLWGQVGDATSVTRLSPVQVGSLTTWLKVSAGQYHAIGLRSGGTLAGTGSLWAWGLNQYGELGLGSPFTCAYPATSTATSCSSPTQIGLVTKWSAVSAGFQHSVALQTTGTVGTAPNITPVTVLYTWGNNASGQLGLGTSSLDDRATRYTPTLVPASSLLTGTQYWKAISAGGWPGSGGVPSGSFTLALRSDGTIFSWGDNSYDQLGQLTPGTQSIPATVFGPYSGASVADANVISAGGRHALAVDTSAQLWAWGNNDSGQAGQATSTALVSIPTQVGTDTDWLLVAAGGEHSLAIKKDGSLWAWGLNADGQLGDGTLLSQSAPERIGTATNWVAVYAGYSHSLALRNDGTLWAWGRNAEGQLGNGTTTGPVLVPTLVP